MRRTVYKNDKYIANYNNTPGVDELECVEMNFCHLTYNNINENIGIGSCGGEVMGLKIKNCMNNGFDSNIIDSAIKIFKLNTINISEDSTALNRISKISNMIKNFKNLTALNEVAKHAIDNMKKEEVTV